MPTLVARTLVLLPAIAATGIWFLDLCHLVYRCGCVSWWQGAAAHCNIQQPGPPDCPWCATGLVGTIVPFGAVIASQAMVALGPWRWSLFLRFALAVLAFPVVGALVGAVFGLATGYWQ